MRIVSWVAAACLGGLLGLVAACDSAPGPEELGLRPPLLQDFTFSPQRVVFGVLPPEQIVGDSVRVPLELSVVAFGTQSPIEEVSYVVQSPFSSFEPIATGTMQPQGNNRYAATTTITFSALEVASYPIVVYAVDQARRVSGEVRGQINYIRIFEPGEPPVIDEVVAPDTLQRPAVGQPAVMLPLIAVVSDPDGLSDVEKVEFWNVDTPNNRFDLCDDGGGQPCGVAADSGDETAGDGRYTLTVFIASTNTLGANTFAFQAIDRAGLRSEIVEKQIVVE